MEQITTKVTETSNEQTNVTVTKDNSTNQPTIVTETAFSKDSIKQELAELGLDGLAFDINTSDTWKKYLEEVGFVPLKIEKHHYDWTNGVKNIEKDWVLFFQKLWNYNIPHDKIKEDGLYGN